MAAARFGVLLLLLVAQGTAQSGPGLGNLTFREDEVWRPVAWMAQGLDRHYTTSFMADGYLVLPWAPDGSHGGSAGFDVWDVSNPRRPQLVKTWWNGAAKGLDQQLQVVLWNRGGQIVLAAHKNNGIRFLDVTSIRTELTVLGEVTVPASTGNYNGIRWLAGQAPYFYAVSKGDGLFVVDASDPTAPSLVATVPTGRLGGISPSVVHVVGNLLVASEIFGRGHASVDVSNPSNPVLIQSIEGVGGYSHLFTAGLLLTPGGITNARRMFVYSVDHEGQIRYAGEAGQSLEKEGGYGAYQDGHFFAGFSDRVTKFSINPPKLLGKGTSGREDRDEDFAHPLGNLILATDDHGLATTLIPHQAERDTKGADVVWMAPAAGATDLPVTTPVGASMSDSVTIESVTAESFRVSAPDGTAVAGQLSVAANNVNFVPDAPLAAGATYSVAVCGIKDLAGNAGSCTEWTFTTATGATAGGRPGCRLDWLDPIETNAATDYEPLATTNNPTSFTWSFGNGQTVGPQSTPKAAFTFASPGRYPIALTVSNAHGQSNCSTVQIVHAPVAENAPVSSSSITTVTIPSVQLEPGVLRDITNIYVANPDNNTVTKIGHDYSREWEAPVGDNPRTVAVGPTGNIWVANQGSGDLTVLDPDGGLVQTVDLGYGSAPYGIVFAPDGRAGYVTLEGEGSVAEIHAAGIVLRKLDVGPQPRGIAVSGDSRRILVTRFVSEFAEQDSVGEVYEVDSTTFARIRTFELGFNPGPDTESGGRGVPNYLSQIRISPDDRTAWIPSKQDNIARGRYRDGLDLDFESQTRAVASQIDLSANTATLDRRIDFNDRDLAQAMAFTPLGHAFVVALEGSNSIQVWDANTRDQISELDVGRAPAGLAFTEDGRRLFVHNFLDRSVTVVNTEGLLRGVSNQPIPIATISTVAEETLGRAVLRGKRIFYNASDPRMNLDGYISCASCHLDGGSDGMVWDRTQFGEGLRNTIDLRGRAGTNGGFVHWTANFDEIQDFEHDMRNGFGGTGFMSDSDFQSGTRADPLGDAKAGVSRELDDLAAYLSSLDRYPDSPYKGDDGLLTAGGLAGKRVFEEKSCAACHSGVDFSDDGTHDVGTIDASSGQGSGAALTGINTPTLKGLWLSAPYLHNGKHATLTDVLSDPTHMGSELTSDEKRLLVEYLRQLDDQETAAEVAMTNAELAALTLSGVHFSFRPDLTDLAVQADPTLVQTTVAARTRHPAATVEISPADADEVVEGHQVSLSQGIQTVIVVTVTAADGETTQDYTLTVQRGIPLTASFSSMPEAHEGAETFSFRIAFSEPVSTSYLVLRDQALQVTFGDVLQAFRVDGRDDLREVVIAPSPYRDVGVVLPATVDCAAPAAVCTTDGRPLSNRLEAVIRGRPPPQVSIEATASPVKEGTAAAFIVTLDNPALKALPVSVSVTETGDTLAGSPSSVTVRKGNTSATLTVPTTRDSVVGKGSTVRASVTGGPDYIVGGVSSASVTVEDGDVAEFAVSAAPETIREGETATLTVATSNWVTFAEDQTITLAVSGTASAADYTELPATLVLAAGTSSVTATLTALEDQEEEAVETVTVTASHGGSAIGSATVTIESVSRDATLSTLSLSGIDIGTFSAARTAYTASVAHGTTSTTVTATPSHARALVSIDPGPEVPLAEGATEITVTVTAEDGETAQVYTVAVTRAAPPLTASWASLPESHSGSGTVVLQVLFSEPVSTSYVTLRDKSFQATNGLVQGARRVDGRNDLWEIQIRPSADADLVVMLPATADCEAAGAVCTRDGKPLSTRLEATIAWEQTPLPVVSVVAVEERVLGPFGEVTVSRTGPTGEPLEVKLLRSSSDRPSATAVTAQFQRGQSSVRKGVQIGDNNLVEDDITVTWTLQERDGYAVSAEQSSATVVLEESEVPEFAVTAEPAVIAEGETAAVRVAITNGVRFSQAETIALAVGGTATESDYTGLPATLALPARGTLATATLAAVADGTAEAAETVVIAASHAGEELGTATVTIGASEAGALTAAFAGMPERHGGAAAAFAFELRFSEEVRISYLTLRDTAFQVTAGAVTGARRLAPPSNLHWEITVEPASDADLVLALPVTTDCAAQGAVCTRSGKALSERIEATVRGPGSEPSGEGFPLARENSRPSGIWSDGETAWVADQEDARLYAYRRSDGERQPERDIATGPAPMGLWSDGETLWVAGLGGGIRAHRLANGSRQPWRDLGLEANAAPAGIWSDGRTLWVADWLGSAAHAYRLADGQRRPGRDIKLDGGNLMPAGLWSDGQTLWVADWRERVYAYRLSDGGRAARRDIEAGAADTDPTGLWSAGGTLLATGWEGGEVRAYRFPEAVETAPEKKSGGGLVARAASMPVIADPALQAAIGEAVGKAPGEAVSPRDLAGLEALAARDAGIRDLSGLEQAVKLKELDIGFNPLADLRPLAALPALESLNLDGAATDLQALASLSRLQRLSLRSNAIGDLWPLAGLVSLAELDVGDNHVADLRPLSGLGALAVLRVDRNRIADLWPLASLVGLEALDLGANRIRDLQPLAGLARLQSLRLAGNGLAALDPLSGLGTLRDLGLAGNAVENLRALSHLEGLRRLDLRGNPVGDLRPLRAVESLAWVHVGGSRIEDLTPVDGLSGLTVEGREDLEPPIVDGRQDEQAGQR